MKKKQQRAGHERAIDSIQWCLNRREAFVTFMTFDDVEQVLMKVGLKMKQRCLRLYRSSMAQREHDRLLMQAAPSATAKCEAYLAQKSLAQCSGSGGNSVRDDQSVSGSSMVSLGGLSIANLERMIEMKRKADSAAQQGGPGEPINRVLVRGFPCGARKSAVLKYLEGIHVPNGTQNMNCVNDDRNDMMEAYVDVASAEDHDAALKRHGRMFEGRIISGSVSKAFFDQEQAKAEYSVVIWLVCFSFLISYIVFAVSKVRVMLTGLRVIVACKRLRRTIATTNVQHSHTIVFS